MKKSENCTSCGKRYVKDYGDGNDDFVYVFCDNRMCKDYDMGSVIHKDIADIEYPTCRRLGHDFR